MTRYLFAIGLFGLTSYVYSQEMRFLIEKHCIATGSTMNFNCESRKGEFLITKSGTKFSGTHPEGGPKQNLKIVKSTSGIVVLDYPVSFDGTSTVNLTDNYSKVYWVTVASSDFYKEREISIVSGQRIK